MFFVWRDIKVRYKQTVLGGLWVIIQPVAATLLFTVIFGRLVPRVYVHAENHARDDAHRRRSVGR